MNPQQNSMTCPAPGAGCRARGRWQSAPAHIPPGRSARRGPGFLRALSRAGSLACAVILTLCGSLASRALAQTNVATLAPDGAWTWYNDPRALFQGGTLYFGYVRSGDGRPALSAYDPLSGTATSLWSSSWTERDDHDNPGLLRLQDGRLLALYAHHGSTTYFNYRTSLTTNPVAAADWSGEQTFTTTASVTYCNPCQLSAESGRIYDFMRDLNYNPTFTFSDNLGSNWSVPQLLIKTGTNSSIRPYVKYSSDSVGRVDFLYTDGHPRDLTNSLYHAYYRSGGLYRTDGSFLKYLTNAPLLHDAGERGSVIYQYADAPAADPNDHIPTGRAWCWEIVPQTNGQPVCVFTVQRDNVTGTNWFDDRIYYYYARWTGSNWQKRFIAQAGRPLYTPEVDYAGGICLDPDDPAVIYISSNAAEPFNLSDTTNVALRANSRYEIWKGVTTDGGLSFSWQAVTTNSATDNLRPYVPRGRGSSPLRLIWFTGTYTSYTSWNTKVVGLQSNAVPRPPSVQIVSPNTAAVSLPNLTNRLALQAAVSDDGLAGPLVISWATLGGPTNAAFADPAATNTSLSLPQPGLYLLRLTASNRAFSSFADLAVQAGDPALAPADPALALWLKFDESAGVVAADSSGNGNTGAVAGAALWRPAGGMRAGALKFNGSNGEVVVPDRTNLDNTAAFTLAYWFRADAWTVDSGGLVCKRDGASSNNAYTTYLKRTDQHLYVDIDGSNDRFASASVIVTGAWYHVALVFDGSLAAAQRVRLWINGSLDVTAAESSAAVPNYSSNLRVGNTHSGAANWFDGLIDDVRFYRRALGAGEIAALAATNAAPSVACGPVPTATNGVMTGLSGTASDDGKGGPLTVLWSQVGGPAAVVFGSSSSPATTVTFGQVGAFRLRLSARDTTAEVFDELEVQAAPNPNIYGDWIALALPDPTNPAARQPSEDPDADGVQNFVEFALGMDPDRMDARAFAPGQPGLPAGTFVSVDGANYLAMTVRRPVGRIGVGYVVEVSADLLTWTAATALGPAYPNGDGSETVAFRDVIPVEQAARRFIRLRVVAW